MRHLFTTTAVLLISTTFASANPVEICLFEEEDWAATYTACNEALAASTSDRERGRFVLHRGLAQEELGNQEAARLDFLLAAEYRPGWSGAYINAAGISEALGELDQQERWALAAVEADPDNPNAYAELLYIRNNDDDPTSCEQVATQLMEALQDPIDWPFAIDGNPYLMGNLGFCLADLERPQEALQAYLAAEYLGLDESWFYESLAHLSYYALEQDERAVEAATRALSYDEEPLIQNVYVLVQANHYLDQHDEAIAAANTYADLLDAEDQTYGVRNSLAWSLYLNDNPEAASGIIEQWVASLGPEHQTPDDDLASTWDTAAHIRAALGDPEGALEAFRQSLSLNTDEYDEQRPETYRRELEGLGISVAEGEEGLMAGLAECVATGAACRLFFADDEAAQAAQE